MATSKRVFCDTNFLLDVFDAEREEHESALALLWYYADNPSAVELIASITSFKDAYYILTRLYKDESLARESIRDIMGTFVQPVDMLSSYGTEALESDEPDFEDGLIRACAEHEQAAVFVTHDKKGFRNCPIPCMTAAEFLEREGFTYEVIDI